jgi:hypothetical protein
MPHIKMFKKTASYDYFVIKRIVINENKLFLSLCLGSINVKNVAETGGLILKWKGELK